MINVFTALEMCCPVAEGHEVVRGGDLLPSERFSRGICVCVSSKLFAVAIIFLLEEKVTSIC